MSYLPRVGCLAGRRPVYRLARGQRTLLVGTSTPAPVWHLTTLAVERFPGMPLDPVAMRSTPESNENPSIHVRIRDELRIVVLRHSLTPILGHSQRIDPGAFGI